MQALSLSMNWHPRNALAGSVNPRNDNLEYFCQTYPHTRGELHVHMDFLLSLLPIHGRGMYVRAVLQSWNSS